MSNSEQKKQAVARAAIEYVEYDDIIGVGTGSTVDYFIEYLKPLKNKISGTVASSISTKEKLEANGIRVIDLNEVSDIPIYIDGADEVNSNLQLIKGGGGALTREKIIAGASQKFLCIVDESKVVDVLGKFPLPLEVLPMARSFVAREIIKIKGMPAWREGLITDNGNIILDINHLDIIEPIKLEKELNQIPGVVTVGLFAARGADKVLVSNDKEVIELKKD
ncbi:MAG: ribose-5-phosphate isomerase RpiA [Gammaproteobacteria bacterium]|jgi:ribose 5-phosphate isomerase A|nr:ribose-5-phosphate isomerase RpiA [Gammaproteobacteria bacterium]MBT6755514.1 ribose-5-phosphate isomerase RpiA [Gammaproteobacteria bacterium]MBT7523799.1 ribose-5-phosphate isomerase RpiA [Gammaproteobacteria bacterium]